MDFHLGIFLAQFLEIALAADKVVALWSSGISFQTLAIWLDDRICDPGTGGRIWFEVSDLVDFIIDLSLKRHWPSGFIVCLAFQTVIAIMEATDSLRHFI